MSKLFSKILTALASLGGSSGTTACLWTIFDEPVAPKSLIEK